MMDQDSPNSDAPLSRQESSSPAGSTAPSAWRCYSSSRWWRNAVLMSFFFARHCVVPAVVWAATFSVVFACFAFAISRLQVAAPGLTELLQGFFVELFALLVAVPMLVYCLAAWLVRLTAYSCAFVGVPREEMISSLLDKQRILTMQSDALARTREHKAFLAKFCSGLTVVLLPVLFACIIALVLVVGSEPKWSGPMAFNLPPAVLSGAQFFLISSALYITGASFAGICISSTLSEGPLRAVKRTLSLSLSLFFPLMALTIVTVLFNTLITSPREIMQLGKTPTADQFLGPQLWLAMLEEFWRAFTSTFMWTFSLAPVCELLRGKH